MKKIALITIITLVIISTSCLQLQQMANMSECEFRLKNIENLKLAGVDIQNIKSYNDVAFFDANKLIAAAISDNMPLRFRLNLDIKNPNQSMAAMNKLDWILLIDGIEIVKGISNQRVEVPAKGISTMPLEMLINLKEALSGKSRESILNFGFNLAGIGGEPTRFTLKAKPTIMVGKIPIAYPGYISIKKEFTSK